MSKELTYTNNGDGSHTVRRNGKVLGKVQHSRPWWVATAGLRGVGGLGSMTEAGERLAEWADIDEGKRVVRTNTLRELLDIVERQRQTDQS